jgi:hypothetical protein
MVVWRANGSSSVQEDCYSSGYSQPATDAVNTYTTTFTASGGNVTFTSTRKLAGEGGSKDFLIQLD